MASLSPRKTRKTGKTRKTRKTRLNLLTAGKLRPPQLSKREVGLVLGVPRKRVRKVVCLPHQVCVSWRDEKGRACSSFFSYRIFPSWQRAVIARIGRCQDVLAVNELRALIAAEYRQFKYSEPAKEAINEALSNREGQLIEANP